VEWRGGVRQLSIEVVKEKIEERLGRTKGEKKRKEGKVDKQVER
jgi:hypothetical protein